MVSGQLPRLDWREEQDGRQARMVSQESELPVADWQGERDWLLPWWCPMFKCTSDDAATNVCRLPTHHKPLPRTRRSRGTRG